MIFRPRREGCTQTMRGHFLGFDCAEFAQVFDGGFEMVLDGTMIEMFATPIIEASARCSVHEYKPVRLDFDTVADLSLALLFDDGAQVVGEDDDIANGVFPTELVLGWKFLLGHRVLASGLIDDELFI